MEEFATNDKTNYYSRIASIMVNGKRAYELKVKFLDDLRDNVFNGTNREDANNGQEGVADKEFSDAEKGNDEQEMAEFFRIETNLFDYEAPLTKTYEDYENKLNDELEEPWSEDGVPYEIYDHICKPFHFKNRKAKWPTFNSNEEEFCNEGELHGMVQRNHIQGPYANYYSNFLNNEEHEDKDKHGLLDNQKWLVCNIRRFEMIKYSFGEDEEYVAIKEHEYDDLMSRNEDACRTYQEIFHRMDEGWMDLAGKEIDKVGKVSIIWNPVCVVVMLETRQCLKAGCLTNSIATIRMECCTGLHEMAMADFLLLGHPTNMYQDNLHSQRLKRRSASSFGDVAIGVPMLSRVSIKCFLSISKAYLDWLIKIPHGDWWI
ncbi:hypothetical protein Tco_1491218 [Tanacetum coccineum]